MGGAEIWLSLGSGVESGAWGWSLEAVGVKSKGTFVGHQWGTLCPVM